MFEHIGRHPDRGYALRQFIAIVIGVTTVTCTGVSGAFAWLGWKAFWLFVAFILYLLHSLFPSVPLMDLSFLEVAVVEVHDVEIEDDEGWIDEPLNIDFLVEAPLKQPELPELEPIRNYGVLRMEREAPREKAMLMAIIGTVGSNDNAIADLFSDGDLIDVFAGEVVEVAEVAQVMEKRMVQGLSADSFIGVLGGSEGGVEGGMVGRAEGGVVGGVIGGLLGSDRPTLIHRASLEIERQGSCDLTVIVRPNGRGSVESFGNCPKRTRDALRAAVEQSRWEKPASVTSPFSMHWSW